MLRCYLAGPFFTLESRLVLKTLLVKLEELGHEVWAPMRDGILCPKNADKAERQKVFDLDCERLHWANCIIALLDYPLPVHQQLMMRSRTPEGMSQDVPLNLPDSGTVFEIGYVCGLNSTGQQYRYIIGYTGRMPSFNLMIAEACDCIVDDLDKLERVMGLIEACDKDGLMLLKTQYQKELQEF